MIFGIEQNKGQEYTWWDICHYTNKTLFIQISKNNNNYKIYDSRYESPHASKYSHHTLQFSADLCGRYNRALLPAGVSSVFRNFGLYTL